MSPDVYGFAGPIIVTGANGFIGRHLCSRLAAAGEEVHAVVRSHSTRVVTQPPGVVVHSLRDSTAEYASVADAVQPAVVFHLATFFAPRHQPSEIARMVEANVTFGASVADATARSGARLVHTTSAWQHYGGADYSPVSLYAATKQALCDLIQHFTESEGLVAQEVCLFDTYGPRDDRKKLMSLMLDHAASGEALPMSSGRQLVDLTHVDDVVGALLQVASGHPLGARLVARGGKPLTIRGLATLVERVTGRSIDARWGVRPARPREMEEDWIISGAATPWRPQIDLATGVARLWDARTSARLT
ncbi:MAG: NAD(P)-dependent oxidoreductase [Actinomycetota bacterium]